MSQETIEPQAGNPGVADVYKRLLIGGELVDIEATYESINPATGAVLGTAPDAGIAEAERAIAAARDAFENSGWATDVELRKRCLTQLAAVLREHAVIARAYGTDGIRVTIGSAEMNDRFLAAIAGVEAT